MKRGDVGGSDLEGGKGRSLGDREIERERGRWRGDDCGRWFKEKGQRYRKKGDLGVMNLEGEREKYL